MYLKTGCSNNCKTQSGTFEKLFSWQIVNILRMKSELFRIISYDVNIMYHVSGGPTEQIVAALLTENQLCAVWQDRVPDVHEHGPNNMMLS